MLLPWPDAPVTLSIQPQQFCLTAQQHWLAQLKGTVLFSPFQIFPALPLLASGIAHAGDQLSNAMTISIWVGLGTQLSPRPHLPEWVQETAWAAGLAFQLQHNPKLDQASHDCAHQYLWSYPSVVFLNLCVPSTFAGFSPDHNICKTAVKLYKL